MVIVGSLVANYPYDDSDNNKAVFSPSPDHDVFLKVNFALFKDLKNYSRKTFFAFFKFRFLVDIYICESTSEYVENRA